METNQEQVTRNIASIRTRRGLTQEDVARKMGITTRTMINIENKPFEYSILKLNELANVLECNIDEFFLPLVLTKSEKEKE